ncbi:MAG: hypothetical protein ABR555_14045, partial [Pyrinomonadaceae bacterium]
MKSLRSGAAEFPPPPYNWLITILSRRKGDGVGVGVAVGSGVGVTEGYGDGEGAGPGVGGLERFCGSLGVSNR